MEISQNVVIYSWWKCKSTWIQTSSTKCLWSYSPRKLQSPTKQNRKLPALLLRFLLVGFWGDLSILAPEAMPSAMNEYIFERRLAHAERLNLSRKRFDHIRNKTMSIFNL